MKKIVILLTLSIIAACGWYAFSLLPVDSSSADRVKVTVESGWSTTQIANHLGEKGILRSPLAFRLYTKIKGLDGSLQAGTFLFQRSHSVSEIAAILQTGRAEEMTVTIPEGFTVKDIDTLFVEAGLMETGAIIDCASRCDFSTFDFLPSGDSQAERGGKLEGYLYPDTYYVSVTDFVPKFFLERMLGNFRTLVLEPYAGLIEASDHTLHETVTMASLVEEETRTDEERPIVAGILWKRFDEGWGLGVDAAVRYVVDKPLDILTHGDLNVNSAYNLRKFKGLPPGPIASAGKKSFEAVLYPKDTPYWYYLHDKEGTIHYSRTNEEHNTKRYMYLGGGSEE